VNALVLAILVLAAGGALGFALAALGRARAGAAAAAAAALAAGAIGLRVAVGVLLGEEFPAFRAPWTLPGAEVRLGVDGLSAVFLLPVFSIGPLAAVYGAGYLGRHAGGRPLGPPLLLFNLLIAAMAVVVTARHAFLFIFAWELMTLLAFLLVSFEDEREEVRRAAFLYVALSHVSAMLVVAFVLVAARDAGSFDLDALAAAAPGRSALAAGALFLCALLGFGTKAGIAPLHIWLPRAHPAAPSHVSAVMSAVIVKTALYALVRALSILGPAPMWWGGALLAIGVVTAVGGILFGVVQGDLKRLLAYSTIENVGIVLIGLGTGLLGAAAGNAAVAVLGCTAALLHVLHHAVMKGLLFLGAGAVLAATHARSVERLGGLLRRMPASGGALLVGALAISALPPFCGFASEWLVYASLLKGALELPSVAGAAAIAAVPALALAGGLAAAALLKAFGLAFLGAPRSEEAARAAEVPLSMRAPLLLLAAAALLLGVAPLLLARLVAPVAGLLARVEAAEAQRIAASALAPLAYVSWGAAALLAAGAGLAVLRRALLSGRPVEAGPTWGCGYGAPTARMQYTGASFARPLAGVAAAALAAEVAGAPPSAFFPASGASARSSRFEDPAEDRLFAAGARRIEARLLTLRRLQQGRLQQYLLYILLAVVALLAWQLLVSSGRLP
jgi:formate hydrogenlyase subunit 3/multisubunit Na+/H+ antiporter MnhD subunit